MSDSHNNQITAEQIITNHCGQKIGASAWKLAQQYLLKHHATDFDLHLAVYHAIYPEWRNQAAPAWFPNTERSEQANLTTWLQELKLPDYSALHRWSHENYTDFWQKIIHKLGIVFHHPYTAIANVENGIEHVAWLPQAKLNAAESCFNAEENAIAIIQQTTTGLQEISYADLNNMNNRVANSLVQFGLQRGDAVAIDMLMDADAVAIYLGIIKAGCVAVSIADSFAATEVQARLEIANTKAIFVHDVIRRGNKILPLYEKILSADLPQAIVIPTAEKLTVKLRANDLDWHDFLSSNTKFSTITCNPGDYSNILFSSGTTGTPKAIPWTHKHLTKSNSV